MKFLTECYICHHSNVSHHDKSICRCLLSIDYTREGRTRGVPLIVVLGQLSAQNSTICSPVESQPGITPGSQGFRWCWSQVKITNFCLADKRLVWLGFWSAKWFWLARYFSTIENPHDPPRSDPWLKLNRTALIYLTSEIGDEHVHTFCDSEMKK